MGGDLRDWRKHLAGIEALSRLDFNYDVRTFESSKDKLGWNVDRHRALLGKEPPGPPVPGGVYERICRAIRNYEFPDPRLIRALFDPGQELAGRNMLMEAHFLGLTFYFGVRVTAVIDEYSRNEAGHEAKIWGYSYRTLKGHFEIGEIRFQAEKDMQTGAISFDIDAYSRPDRISNLFYRIGFRLAGRPLQKYFARSSIARMRGFAQEAATDLPAARKDQGAEK